MARRHLTLTLDITLDEDLCRDAEDKVVGTGDSVLDDDLNYLRTTIAYETGRLLRGYDVQHGSPRIDNCGITYRNDDGTEHVDQDDFEDWVYEVRNGDTKMGYVAWRAHRAEGLSTA